MQVRGRKICLMNKVRMSILRQLWNDQRQMMIENLKKPGPKKKEASRRKHLQAIMRVKEDLREHALKSYFHYCKERAAKSFIEWRIKLAKLIKDPEKKKAIRFARLSNFHRYDLEEQMFKLYEENNKDFDAVLPELI